MYSVMLMMAMTSGGDLPNLGHHGCCGGYSASCCGSYVATCCGGSSCCGGRHRLFGGRHSSCCGGYSACSGYSACGCNTTCCGGYTTCGGGMMYQPAYGGVIIEKKPEGTKPEEIKTKPETKPESLVPTPATIIVSLPADAKLSIDDAATISTSAVRVFTSPELPIGQDFHYNLKAEYVRDGKPVVLSKDVTVRAGEQTRVNMEETAGVASR
jgi:uncharacterized protein (TIGR03000 family)